jgi:hypothetical protein
MHINTDICGSIVEVEILWRWVQVLLRGQFLIFPGEEFTAEYAWLREHDSVFLTFLYIKKPMHTEEFSYRYGYPDFTDITRIRIQLIFQ